MTWAAFPWAWSREHGTATDSRSLGARVADGFAKVVGSWRFIIAQSLVLAVWVWLNSDGVLRADPFPFILLNLLLSLQAAYTGPILLMSNNRAAAQDRAVLVDVQSDEHEELTDLQEIQAALRIVLAQLEAHNGEH